MSRLEELAQREHPYYCSLSNYYSNEASLIYETMTEFLEAWEENDVDMNLVFRWDIHKSDSIPYFTAEVFIIQQRKGIFKPIYIRSVEEKEIERFENYLKLHKAVIDSFWNF